MLPGKGTGAIDDRVVDVGTLDGREVDCKGTGAAFVFTAAVWEYTISSSSLSKSESMVRSTTPHALPELLCLSVAVAQNARLW